MKIINTPGKFEGCFDFVPFFYDLINEGSSDDLICTPEGIYLSFFDLDPYHELFSIPEKFKQLEIWEDSDGFIHSVLLEDQVYKMMYDIS